MDIDTDFLNLATNPHILQVLRKNGGDERVVWSSNELKVNWRGKSQKRVLVITNKALYNFRPKDIVNFKRRIRLSTIGCLTISSKADEFILQIPEEYDYRYRSQNTRKIALLLRNLIMEDEGRKLKISIADQGQIEEFIVTKHAVMGYSREEIILRKKRIALQAHDSDNEEQGDHFETKQLLSTQDKPCIDDFELLKVLGRGAFGKVMQVRYRKNGKVYAMKILKKPMVFAKKQVDHTLAERKVLQGFQHPFLVGLEFAFQTEAKLYLVMNFYKGGELFFHLRKVRRFTEDQARMFIAEVALALGHLHSLNFIYRDLKPENILMDDEGHICLTDFGLAKQLKTGNDSAHSFVGTPEYLAPEMVKNSGHNKGVDWWCLGILLYELTVGVTPFYSGNVDDMYKKIVNSKLRFPPRLSEECRDLITALLKKNPSERLGSSVSDVDEIKLHPFFKSVNWDRLVRKEVIPKYKPQIGKDDDFVGNFSNQFLKEKPEESVIPESQLRALPKDADQAFDQWTFQANNHLLTKR